MYLYVAPNGDDDNPGTKEKPFATLKRARDAVQELKKKIKKPVTVLVREGTYYQDDEPLVFRPEDSGTAEAPITYAAYPGELVTISGGRKLNCQWRPYKDGIMMCELPEVKTGALYFTQLFVNGKRQIRARYPNYDPENPLVHGGGYINAAGRVDDDVEDPYPDPNDDMTFSSGAPRGIYFDPKNFTKKKWAKPYEAIIHIFQDAYWGNLQWRIKAIDYEKNIIWFGHGGHQMGAKWDKDPCGVSKHSRFYIENVFEELDAPGEWYLDEEEGILYYKPDEEVNLKEALIEVPVLQRVIQFLGTQDNPVHHITLEGFRITHTASTFLEKYEVPSLSDWAIHRGGAVFMEGARDCTIKNCWFDAVGGNAVFMNNYNRGNVVTGCKFTEAGDSAICFVGSLESTVGTQRNFLYECKAINNLIHDCGVFGKQIAGVYISRAKRITVSHNLIYNMPRAGICIGDGTWGGHVIEYNYIQNTCRETGDHGPFNAWGRDRYWCLYFSHADHSIPHPAGDVFIDAQETVVIRHNYFRENSGWGIDLDDGASNYHIYNNLCVGCGIKLREGDYRTIENNIFVNPANSPCFHVGNAYNHDRFVRNIIVMSSKFDRPEIGLYFEKAEPMSDLRKDKGEIYSLIYPPAEGPWLEEIDYNVFFNDLGESSRFVSARLWGNKKVTYTLKEWRTLGYDVHSIFADPMFVDPKKGDYRVKPESPALKLGFKNFDMDKFGLLPDFPEKWLNKQEKCFIKYRK